MPPFLRAQNAPPRLGAHKHAARAQRARRDLLAWAGQTLNARNLLSMYWFVFFAALGVFFPFFSLYLDENAGLSGTSRPRPGVGAAHRDARATF
jgi:hypothetical protein